MTLVLPDQWLEIPADIKPAELLGKLREIVEAVQRNFDAVATQFPASVSMEGLRIVRGVVSSAGVASLGSGFSSSRTAAGQYTVTWSPAFSATPAVVVMCGTATGSFVAKQKDASTASASQVLVTTFSSVTGTATDSDFYFIAAGVGIA